MSRYSECELLSTGTVKVGLGEYGGILMMDDGVKAQCECFL